MTKKVLFSLAISVMMLASCGNTPTNGESAVSTSGGSVSSVKDITIAYINVDSLISSYNLYKDLNAKYETKATQIGTELEAKGRTFSGKATDFQNKVQKGLITRSQAEEQNASLEKEQQNLIAYRDKMLAELSEEEAVMHNNVLNNIDEYLKKYNANGKYSLILNKTVVLNGSDALDITQEIIDGLNSEYTPEK